MVHVALWIVRIEDDNNFARSLFTPTETLSPWTHQRCGCCISLLQSFMMGNIIFSEPLYPWAIEMAAAHDTLDAALPKIIDYSIKRGRKMLLDMQKSAA